MALNASFSIAPDRVVPISHSELFNAICQEIDRQGVKVMQPRHFNVVIEAANEIIHSLQDVYRPAIKGMSYQQWLNSDAWGQSSKYLASVVRGEYCESNHPHEAGDFGRCVTLLHNVTGFDPSDYRKMQGKGEVWDRLIAVWPQAEALYLAGNVTECDKIVRQAVKGSNPH